MSSGRLLVMALNLTGPIPNAAAINSHLPDSILLIRSKSMNEGGENRLNESLKRLQAWVNGTLPEIYGFDHDINLKYPPDELQISPQIEVLEVESTSSSSIVICDEIKRICESSGHSEVRIDVAGGRKEDAAALARVSKVAEKENMCTVWYTDATSGTSVEIGGELVEKGESSLSQMTRFWLSGSPILGVNQELVGEDLRGDLLTLVLDSIEQISESKQSEERRDRDRLIHDLDGLGIVHSENWERYKFYRKGLEDECVEIPRKVFARQSGLWLESVVGLAIIDAWDCERVYVGVAMGHPEHEERMGCLQHLLRLPHQGRELSRVWTDCHAEGILPDKFLKLDFLDSKSVYTRLDGEEATGFNVFDYAPPKWAMKEHPDIFPGKWAENEKMIGRFANWVAYAGWKVLPSGLREYLMPFCKYRDLDVFAETASHSLFVECKLGPEAADLPAGSNKAQIDSLLFSTLKRGVKYSILIHNRHDIDTWRSGEFDFIAPWSKLRRPEEMLKSVIKSGYPTKWWWKSGGGTDPSSSERSVHPYHLAQEEKVEQGVTHGPNSKKKRRSRGRGKGWDGWTPTREDSPPPTDEVPEGKFFCPECMDSFDSAFTLNEHRQKTGHSSYKCEECSEILITDKRVIHHNATTEHKKISGKNFPSERLWRPFSGDPAAEKTLLECGFYDKAIENRWDSAEFCRMLAQETGKKHWKEIYGGLPKNKKVIKFFNDERPGLVLFIQGEDGKWYASRPDVTNQDE